MRFPAEIFRDSKGQLSWGRVAAAVCLAQACALAWAGRSESLIGSFLLAAFGSYGTSKAVEAKTTKTEG